MRLLALAATVGAALGLGARRPSHAQRGPRGSSVVFADPPGRGTGTPLLQFQWGEGCAQLGADPRVIVTNPGGIHAGFSLCVLESPRRGVGFASAKLHVIAAVRAAVHRGVDCGAALRAGEVRDWPTAERAQVSSRLDTDGVRVAQLASTRDDELASADAPIARARAAWLRAWVGSTQAPSELRVGIVRSEVIEWRHEDHGAAPQLAVLTLARGGLPDGYWERCVARWGVLVTAYETTPLVAR